MRRWWLVALFVVGMAGSAGAVPTTISFTGRLATADGAVTDGANVAFRLFDAATAGTQVWTEDRGRVETNEGLVFVELGQMTPLDTSIFTGAPMFLEVVVDGEALSPRVSMGSVPYAIHTADADTLGGTVAAGDVVTSVTGANGIAAEKTGNGVAVSLATAGCASGQALKFNGATFACADDADSGAPAAGNGIAVTGNTVSLSTTGCQAGFVQRFNGAAFVCEAEGDGVAGNEIVNATNTSLTRSGSGTAGSPFTIALNTANSNTWTASQTFEDVVVNGTVNVGFTRVVGTAVTASAVGSCSNWNVSTCFLATATATCPSGMVVTGGGCNTSVGDNRDVNIARSFPSSDTTWTCGSSAFVPSTLTAFALCSRIK